MTAQAPGFCMRLEGVALRPAIQLYTKPHPKPENDIISR